MEGSFLVLCFWANAGLHSAVALVEHVCHERESGWNVPLCSPSVRANNHALFHVEIVPDPPQGTWLRV